MADNVIQLSEVIATTTGRVEPDNVLEGAKGVLEEAVVIGITKDGNYYAASSTGDIPTLLYLAKLFDLEINESLQDDVWG